MRKFKFFLSLLMLFCFSVGMRATTITMPATTLDLQNPTMVTTASWTGESAYYLSDTALVVSGYESYKSVTNQTWITFLSTGSSGSTWDALVPFKGSSYYTTASYATLKPGRYTAYRISGCDSVWIYGYNNAATKYLITKIYDVTGSEATSINDTEVDANYTIENQAAGKTTVVLKQALNPAKSYLVVTSGIGDGNSRVYEVAFFRHNSTPSVTVDPTSVAFGDVKQHTKTDDSYWVLSDVKVTGKNLTDNVKLTSNYSPVFNIEDKSKGSGVSYTYTLVPDGDGAIDTTINVVAYTNSTGNLDDKTITVSSAKETPEFTAFDIPVTINLIPTYSISVPAITGGSLGWDPAKPEYAAEGDAFTLTATPASGYEGGTIQILKAEDDSDVTSDVLSGSTLTMPAYAIKVVVTFTEQTCTNLAAPTLNSASTWYTYEAGQLAWTAVEHADKYLVNISKHSGEAYITNLLTPDLNTGMNNLAANTQYDYTVMAVGDGSTYCDESNPLLEGSFTTPDYPAATLTLSENGEPRTWGTDLKVNSVIALPTEVETGIVEKTLVGWSTATITTTDTKPTENFYEPGADYTIQSTTDKLYAVYAAGHGDIDEWRVATSVTAGDVVVISTNTGYTTNPMQTAGVFSGTNTYTSVTNSTYSEDKKTITALAANTLQFTVGGNATDGWTLQNGTKYLAMTGDKKMALITSDSTWTISFDDEVASVSEYVSGQNATYTIKYNYNSGNPRFTGYKSGQVDISLFKHYTASANWSAYATSGVRQLANPTFSPAAGTYTTAQSIELTAAEGTIYYNIDDENDPTSASTAYTAAIALNTYGSHTIKAIAIDGDNKSEVVSATYMINLPFASFEDLVAAGLGSNVEDVTVSFANAEIVSFNSSRKTVTINVKDESNKNIQIYYASTACPTAWAVGGQISGTSITGTWTMYSEARELVISSWDGITYKAPAGIAWSAEEVSAYTAGKAYTLPTLSNPNNLPVTYSSSNFYALDIDASTGEISNLVAGQTTTITATFAGNDTYAAQAVSYTLKIYKPSSLAISGELTTTEYDDGDTFVFDGLTASLTFSDETVEDVTADATWKADGVTTKVLAWPANEFYVEASYPGVMAALKNVTISFKTYAVTFAAPEHGTLVVKNSGNPIGSGNTFVKNTTLTVEATPDAGYELATLTAGGVDIKEAKQFTVGTAAVEVAATFALSQVDPELSWSGVDGYNRAWAYTQGKAFAFPTLNNPNGVEVTYSADGGIITIDETTGVIALVSEGAVHVTATSAATSTYLAGTATYTLYVCGVEYVTLGGDADKKVYEYGDAFDRTGLTVTANYNNGGGTSDVTELATWTIDPETITSNGSVSVTATYAGKSDQKYVYDVKVASYAVTFNTPEHGSMAVTAGGDYFLSGAKFKKGTEVVVTLTPDAGYEGSVTVNGEPLVGNSFNIGTEDVDIVATFTAIPKYFLKSNWANGGWAWLEATYVSATNYTLANVVLGNGGGVNWDGESKADVNWTKYNEFLDYNEGAALDTVTLVLNPVAGTITATLVGKYVAPADPVYTVVGVEALVGYDWGAGLNAAENEMAKQTDGTYLLLKENIILAVADYEYQVAKDHDWRGVSNSKLSIATAGKYNVTFTFNPATGETNAEAEFVEPVVLNKTFVVLGGFNGWSADAVEVAPDAATASFVVNIATANDYFFKVQVNSAWLANGYTYHRDFTGAAGITENGSDMKLQADVAGEYTFTWTFETNALEITFPAKGPGTGINDIDAEGKVEKIFRDGKFYILKGEKTYTIQGQLVK